ncbi:hypothetical protein Aduo_010007 [Ancylostoma duodenale]
MWVVVIALAAVCAPTDAKIVHKIPSVSVRSFFSKVLLQATNEYRTLTSRRDLTLKEMREKALELGEKYGLKKEVEKFYQTQDKKAEEMENKTIALLENAAKAYREYLALFDDSKTLEQIDKEKKKLRSEKAKEYSVFMHARKIVRKPNQNLTWPSKAKVRAGKKEVEEFYQTQNKKAEEMENETIALLENAAKTYREYLALFDDSKTLEQIDEEKKKLRSEKPKEYSVFMHASRIVRKPNQNLTYPGKAKFGTGKIYTFSHGRKIIRTHRVRGLVGSRRQKLSNVWP